MKILTIIIISLLLPMFSLITALATTVSSKNTLSRGHSLSVEDTSSSAFLTSPDKIFTCGFYSLGTKANAFWFSIWFTNSKERTVVWMANRDMPVNRHSSRLTLRKNGVFVLTDYDGSIVWQTNTTSEKVDRAELLNSGNLVLQDPNGKILWQSFDFPTDTLLPSQSFTKSMRLVSKIGHTMFGSGYYSFFFDSDNVLKVIYDGPDMSSIYWPGTGISDNMFNFNRTTYNSSRIANLHDNGTFSSTDELQFRASDLGHGIRRRLTMDYDGNLRLYSLNESSELWIVTWQAVSRQCEIHGLCGRHGICVYTPEPSCSCPPYYEPTSSTDWSKGCTPEFLSSHNDTEFVMMPHVDYYGFDINYDPSPVSLDHCKQLCLKTSKCQAIGYKEGVCYKKTALFNGYRANDLPGTTYLRVPRGLQTSAHMMLNLPHQTCDGREVTIVSSQGMYYKITQKFKWAYMYSFVSAIGAIEVTIFVTVWLFLFTKHGMSASIEDGYRAISSQFRCFSYSELKAATRNFKEVLGIGGFGAVYKGVLADERVMAVKKLGNVFQGEEEFWAEVSTIGRINHMNLARMWGFCSERKHKLLVYEYVENGSLAKHLFSDNTLLGWRERFKVAVGTAKGLAFLHHECLEWVIHCDVKPENILLGEDFEPKIADFGLAKLCERSGQGSSELTKIRGTKGYMAPEWAMNLPITAKVDVYSYGVVILELVKGIRLSNRVVDDDLDQDGASELMRFLRLAKSKIQHGEDLWAEDLVDPRLKGQFNRNQAAVMIEVGLSCVDEDRNKRPTIESVAQVLVECEDGTMHKPVKL